MENYTMLCMLEKTFACCTLLVSQTVLKTVSKNFYKMLKIAGILEIIQDKRLFKTFWELKKKTNKKSKTVAN